VLFDQSLEVIDLLALVKDVRLDMLPEFTATAATLTTDLGDYSTI
jgi:hypothetical protein